MFTDTEKTKFGKDFKFTLFYTAPGEAEAIGIELCKALYECTQKMGLTNFDLKLRLQGGPRWDYDFIEEEMSKLGNAKRVFVCGAPSMNEVFDRAFEQLSAKTSVNWENKLELL